MTQQVDPSSVFIDYRPSRRRWWVLLAAAAVVLLLVGVVYAVRSTVSSPESAVSGYFGALADRDADAALRVLAPEVADHAEPELLRDPVLRSADYLPPADVRTTDVTVDDREAVAAVEFTIDGRQHTATLRLRRSGGLADSVFHRWRIVDGLGSIVLGQVTEQITVNGVPMAARDAQGSRVLTAFPGGYQVGVPEGDPLWEPRTVPATVAPLAGAEVDVPLVVRPGIRDEVDRQVRDILDRCAASTELVPPGCPFGYAVVAEAEDVRWRIDSYPAVAVGPGEELEQPVAVAYSSRDGQATITGSRRFVGEFEEAVPIPISGTVSVRSGSVIFQPGW
jgi:hypothetical protein